MLAVTEDGSPRGRVALALWEPPVRVRTSGRTARRCAAPPTSEAADLLADLVVDGRPHPGVRPVPARRRAGRPARPPSCSPRSTRRWPARVAAYRGGYLPEERRELEERLRSGDLLGLAATNALELGIDVTGLDAVLMAGSPAPGPRCGSSSAGPDAVRGDALGVLVARDDPLDTYLVHHPEALIGQPVEATVFDPDNPYVLGPAPVRRRPGAAADRGGPRRSSGRPAATVVDELDRAPGCCAGGRAAGSGPTAARPPTSPTSARPAGPPSSCSRPSTGRVVGTVDGVARHGTAHAGAVYLHRGETWLVDDLDLDERVAVLERTDPGYSTSAREVTSISVARGARSTPSGAACRLSLGEVEVTHQVVSYLKRRHPGGEVIGEEPLDLPERTLRTVAVWWTVPDDVLDEAGIWPPATSRAPRTPPSTARSGCCRWSRPATGGTSAGSRPRCTPTPAG